MLVFIATQSRKANHQPPFAKNGRIRFDNLIDNELEYFTHNYKLHSLSFVVFIHIDMYVYVCVCSYVCEYHGYMCNVILTSK